MAKKEKDMVKVTHELHHLPCELGEKDRAEAADRLAKALEQAESLALERKSVTGDFKSRLGALNERIHRLMVNVKNGVEMRSIDCELRLNYTKLTVMLVRKDTGEMVEERPMTSEEKQMELDL